MGAFHLGCVRGARCQRYCVILSLSLVKRETRIDAIALTARSPNAATSPIAPTITSISSET